MPFRNSNSNNDDVPDWVRIMLPSGTDQRKIEMSLSRTVDRRLQSHLMQTFIYCMIYRETMEWILASLNLQRPLQPAIATSAQSALLVIFVMVMISMIQLVFMAKPLAEFDKKEATIVLGPQPQMKSLRGAGNSSGPSGSGASALPLSATNELNESSTFQRDFGGSEGASEDVNALPRDSTINTDRVPFNFFPNIKDPSVLMRWYHTLSLVFVIVMLSFVWYRQFYSSHVFTTYAILSPVVAGVLLASDNWTRFSLVLASCFIIQVATWLLRLALDCDQQDTSKMILQVYVPYHELHVILLQLVPLCFLVGRLMRNSFISRKESHFKESTLLLRNASINTINEQVGSIFWLVDKEERVVFTRGSILTDIGKDPKDMEGRHLVQAIQVLKLAPGQAAMSVQMHQYVLQTGNGAQYLLNELDVHKVMQISLTPFKNELKETIGVLGVATDVTELQDQADRLRTVVNSTSDTIIQVNKDLTIEFSNIQHSCGNDIDSKEFRGKSVESRLNQCLCRPCGAAASAASSSNVVPQSRVDDRLQAKILLNLRDLIVDSEARSLDYICISGNTDGRMECMLIEQLSVDEVRSYTLEETTHFFTILFNPLSKEVHNGALMTIRDMTSMKRAQEQQRRIEEYRLRTAWKAEQYAFLSHELKNPLSNVFLGLQLLATTQENLTQQQLGYISDCSENASQLLAILNSSLDLERLDWGRPVSIVSSANNIVDLVETCVDMMTAQAQGKQVSLQAAIDTQNTPLLVFCDRTRLTQIISNLISNAIKFSPKNGTIIISVKPHRIRTSDELNGGSIVTMQISVHDQGQGITQEDLKKLFCTFEQVDPSRRPPEHGHGLGLSIVKYLCEQMNGRVEVQSEYGTGSTFTAYIDMKMVVSEPVQYVTLLLEAPAYDYVLLLEKNPRIRECIVQYLKDIGVANIQVFASEIDGNDKDALERAFRSSVGELGGDQHKCAVLMDAMNFTWLCRVYNEIRRNKHFKLIAMISQSTKSLMDEIVHGDDVTLLKKPIRLSPLVYALQADGHKTLANTKIQVKRVDQVLAGIGHVEIAMAAAAVAADTATTSASTAPASPSQENATETGAILIAEDVEVNRRLLVHLLHKLGYDKIVAAENGLDAMEYLSGRKSCASFGIESPKEIKLVLLDALMPQMSGPETLTAIRAMEDLQLRQIPCVAVTASTTEFPFLELGFADVVAKPVLLNELARVIRRYVAPSKPVAAAMTPLSRFASPSADTKQET